MHQKILNGHVVAQDIDRIAVGQGVRIQIGKGRGYFGFG